MMIASYDERPGERPPGEKAPAGLPCFQQAEEAHGEMKTRRFALRASARRVSPAGLPCFRQEGEAHGEMKTRSLVLRASARRVSPAGLPCFQQAEGKAGPGFLGSPPLQAVLFFAKKFA